MEADLQFPAPVQGPVDVFILAGEHSGDQHGARLVRGLRSRNPGLRIAAVGGPELAKEDLLFLHDLTENSVVGLVEVLRHYSYFKNLMEGLLKWLEAYPPKVLVLVDYPGFNLRLAQSLQKSGLSRKGGGSIAVYQYISPQIWAWKAGRRFKMAEVLDELGVIFPFETECYADTQLSAEFVGHPFVQSDYQPQLAYSPDGGLLLLPGSRAQPVSRIFPVMLETVRRLQEQGMTVDVKVCYPGAQIRDILKELISAAKMESAGIRLISGDEAIEASLVLTSSGTMSLQCALAGIPGLIVYRAHPVTYWIARRLVRVPWLGIANLILNKPVYPEYIQGMAKPDRLAEALWQLHKTAVAARREAVVSAADLRLHLSTDNCNSAANRISALLAE